MNYLIALIVRILTAPIFVAMTAIITVLWFVNLFLSMIYWTIMLLAKGADFNCDVNSAMIADYLWESHLILWNWWIEFGTKEVRNNG